MDEQTAISQLKRGDLTGLETLVGRYQVQAVHSALFIVRDRSLAEDAAQSAFVRIAERIQQFDDERPFGPWFFRIVVNEALKAVQHQKLFVPLDEETDEHAVSLARWLVDPRPQPESLLVIKESTQVVRTALKRLTPEQRAVVVMHYYLEMSETEMSARLERPTSTIKWWLRAARQRLRHLLSSTRLDKSDK
jgi:RNA polymerase sigma-70 factor (ECF subfamily)